MMKKLPEKLLKLRKGHNLSQDFLAKKLGIDVFDYMAIENGRSLVDRITIDRIANIYGLESEELINDELDIRILDLKNELKEENRKYKQNAFLNKFKNGDYNLFIFIFVICLIFFVAIVMTLPKSYNVTVSKDDEPSAVLTANRDTVVLSDKNIKVTGKDDVDFGEGKVVKVVSGINYFAALTEDGLVKTSGFNVKYQKDIDKLKGVIDIESGESHILVLLNNGKVKCIGNNDYNQCEVTKWNNVKKIYADGYGSIAITDEGILTTGDIPHAEKLKDLDFKQVLFNDDTLMVLTSDGKAKLFGDSDYNLEDFYDLKEIALDDSFVAGLKKDGTVVIDIDNYLIIEKCKHLTNVKTIDAGKSYLVCYDGENVYGLGDNSYNQFEEKVIELKPLPSIKNLEVTYDENDLTITFDKVENAQSYLLKIDEINIDIKVEDNKFVLPLSLFEPDTKYILMITAVNVYDLYLESETKHVVFTYTDPDKKKEETDKLEEVVVEIPFVVKDFLNQPKDDFIDYLKSHDYDLSKLETEVVINCTDNHKVLEIEGLKAGEEITNQDLQKRNISYKYCEIGAN